MAQLAIVSLRCNKMFGAGLKQNRLYFLPKVTKLMIRETYSQLSTDYFSSLCEEYKNEERLYRIETWIILHPLKLGSCM